MIECPRCHAAYEEEPAFCGSCGAKMPGHASLALVSGDPLIGLIIDNRYRVLDLIGHGGMGAVYRVEHVKMGKIMAMKILSGELSQHGDLAKRFKREAETASRLSHLHTVSVFDFGSDKGMMYLVMEYIEGHDLADELRRSGPLPANRCYGILIQVCSALTEAHDKGIIHRDLKPENILIGKRDEREDFVTVLDFGLAKLRDLHRTKITEQGSLVGTPYYMAPEHIRSEGVDGRSDLYALGAVAYKLLTGSHPFTAPTPMGIITKHLTEAPTPPSEAFPELGIPKRADAICLKAMAKAPGDRYASAGEMRCALADALEEETPGSPFSRFTTTERPSWRAAHAGAAATTEPLPVHGAASSHRGTEDAPPPSRTSYVVVGKRELAVSTRSDFIHFSKRAKRRTLSWTVLIGVLVLLLLAGIGTLIVKRGVTSPSWTSETEPNDHRRNADPLAPGVPLRGRIFGEQAGGDIDWYRLANTFQGSWAVVVETTGVPGMDLAVQLFRAGQNEPFAVANQAVKGGAEHTGPWTIGDPEVFLAVREARGATAPPQSAAASYSIRVDVFDATGLEIEPNNSTGQATPITLRKTVNGSLGTAGDAVDWFVAAPDLAVRKVEVESSANLDIVLELRLGPGGTPMHVNLFGPGQGETIVLPAGAGPTQIGVRSLAGMGEGGTYSLLVR